MPIRPIARVSASSPCVVDEPGAQRPSRIRAVSAASSRAPGPLASHLADPLEPPAPGATAGPLEPQKASAGSAPQRESYKVGKGKPPVHSRWKKGQSGNPKGRPPGAKNFDTIALEILGEKIPIKTAAGEVRMSTFELCLMKQRELVGKGDLRAILATIQEGRRLMPAPPLPPDEGEGATLTATEQMILEQALAALGLAPVAVQGKTSPAADDGFFADDTDEEA